MLCSPLLWFMGFIFLYSSKEITAIKGVQFSRELPTSERLAPRIISLRSVEGQSQESPYFSILPCGDELDRTIINIAIPATLNSAIRPLVGAVEIFLIGKMANTFALAGHTAANQIFSSTSLFISFLPALIMPIVAKAAGSGDNEALQKHFGESIFIGTCLGVLGMSLLALFPTQMLGLVLDKNSPAMKYASVYLAIRALTFLPSLISTISYAAFRGTLDVVTPLKIALVSNTVNVILDPILIFKVGMGITGAAAATCVAETMCFCLYARKIVGRKMLKLSTALSPPAWNSLKPLLIGGFVVQVRSIAMFSTLLTVTKATQAIDTTGVAAAAHAITLQIWQLGGILLSALGTVALIVVPNEIAKAKKHASPCGLLKAKLAADRLMLRGLFLGIVLAIVQIGCLPLIKVFSPLKSVQKAAKIPAIVGALLQIQSGVISVGEGIQQGNQQFVSLTVCTCIAAAAMFSSLRLFGHTLAGVWTSFAVFDIVRLLGVLRHHFYDGPLTQSKVLCSLQNEPEASPEIQQVNTFVSVHRNKDISSAVSVLLLQNLALSSSHEEKS